MRLSRSIAPLTILIAMTSLGWADDGEPERSSIQAQAFSNSSASSWPALQWKKGTPSPFARVESPAAVIDNTIYLFGGFTDDLGASTQLDVFDPATDSWTRKREMPSGVTHLNAVQDGKTIWFAGGFKGKHPGPVTSEVWKYDATSDTWAPGPPLPEPRAGGGLAAIGRTLHYFGGFKADRDTNAGDHWSLSLEAGTMWQREADLPVSPSLVRNRFG